MKKTFTALAGALIPALAQAWCSLLLGLTVIIIGAVVVYQLVSCIKTVLPDPPPANPPATNAPPVHNQIDPASNWQISFDTGGAFPGTLGAEWGALVPYTFNASGTIPHFSQMPPSGFTVQYGLDALSRPWICVGSNLCDDVVNVQTLVDTATEYSIAVIYGAVTTIFDSTATGCSQVTITNQPTVVIVLRSVDLVNWHAIFTNTVSAGHVQTFTDPAAPANCAFYRLEVLP